MNGELNRVRYKWESNRVDEEFEQSWNLETESNMNRNKLEQGVIHKRKPNKCRAEFNMSHRSSTIDGVGPKKEIGHAEADASAGLGHRGGIDVWTNKIND